MDVQEIVRKLWVEFQRVVILDRKRYAFLWLMTKEDTTDDDYTEFIGGDGSKDDELYVDLQALWTQLFTSPLGFSLLASSNERANWAKVGTNNTQSVVRQQRGKDAVAFFASVGPPISDYNKYFTPSALDKRQVRGYGKHTALAAQVADVLNEWRTPSLSFPFPPPPTPQPFNEIITQLEATPETMDNGLPHRPTLPRKSTRNQLRVSPLENDTIEPSAFPETLRQQTLADPTIEEVRQKIESDRQLLEQKTEPSIEERVIEDPIAHVNVYSEQAKQVSDALRNSSIAQEQPKSKAPNFLTGMYNKASSYLPFSSSKPSKTVVVVVVVEESSVLLLLLVVAAVA